jgi:hypothetical protein
MRTRKYIKHPRDLNIVHLEQTELMCSRMDPTQQIRKESRYGVSARKLGKRL